MASYALSAGVSFPLPANPLGAYCVPGTHPHSDGTEVRWGASDLADRIIKSGYDVVVINEVWWSDAEDILRDELKDVYPFYVQRLDEKLGFEGSGLNLFSKFPFKPVSSGLEDYRNAYFRIGLGGVEHDCDLPFSPACNDFVAHLEYGENEAADIWSSKGVGYVRVENPDTGRRHNVFFTHMQSSYSDEHDPANNDWSGLDVRTTQFNEVKHLVELARQGSDAILAGEDIFVLGDLNVDGDLSNVDSGFGAPTTPYDGNKYEWRIRFKKGGGSAGYEHGGFFNEDVHDTWAYEHPSFDTEQNPNAGTEYGHTGGFGADPTRLDYILSNAAFASDDPLCNQHPHIAYSLLSGDPIFPGHGASPPGGRDQRADGQQGMHAQMFHSDHLGVSSNYNALADHCSPLLPGSAKDLYGSEQVGARVLTEAEVGIYPGGSNNPNDNGDPLPGVLEHPGSVQWYYLAWDGAYLIGFDAASYDLGYQVQVYSADNLSRPVKAYGATEYEQVVGTRPPVSVFGKKYVVQGGPFYIKVYHPTHQHLDLPGNASGSYVLGIDALGCTDKYNDACPIFPNMKYAFEMPSGSFSSSPEMDSMYFDLAVERPTKPAEQRVVFDVFNYPASTLESAIVHNDPNTDIVRTIGATSLEMVGEDNQGTSSAACDCSLSIHTDVPSPEDPSQRMLWRVRRGHGTDAVAFTVVWHTELTVAFGGGIWNELDQMNLVCFETTSDAGKHDEIETEVWVDGMHMSGGPGNAHRHDVGRFGAGDDRSMDQVNAWLKSPWRFKREVRWRLHETDTGGSSNQVDFEVGPIDIFETGPFSAATKDPISVEFDDGHYQTEAGRNHGLQSDSAP